MDKRTPLTERHRKSENRERTLVAPGSKLLSTFRGLIVNKITI